ncbi:MAG: class D sortase [Erysipelothrix sp.]|jgi:LPXTG-site transpeptidase (sortase) family protein|nr:class D sortase [Erysipelothrix sp.]
MNKLVVVKKSKSIKPNRIFPIITIIGLGLIIWSLMSISKQSRFDIPLDITATLAAYPNSIEDAYTGSSIVNQKQNDTVDTRKIIRQLGDHLGTLTIPALNRILPIYEGTTEDQLSKGVGHVVTSVLPGWMDNSVIAGHRGTTFKNVGKLVIDDLIIIESKHGVFTYKIVKFRIVDSDDETVIVSTEKATLTLVTCYPFNWIGAAPKRYIIIAEMIDD